jgi:hypothetical protein
MQILKATGLHRKAGGAQWTHACLSLTLDHISTIPTNDYVRELSDFGFRMLREQTIHTFNCEGFGFTPSRAYSMPTGLLRTDRFSPM